jgi:hypothetical protein
MSFELFGGDEVGEMVEGATVKAPLWWRVLKAVVSFLLRIAER